MRILYSTRFFSVDTFGGEGYSIISDKLGAILIGTKSKNRLCFADNWFDFFKDNKAISISELSAIYSDIQSNRTGIFNFSIRNENRIVVYTPVGVNDWYVLSTVTADYILSQQKKISRITVSLIAVMLLVFAVITFFLVQLITQKMKIEKDNSRYAITSENTQTLIFEYDFATRAIEFTGSSDFLFGKSIKSVSPSEYSLIEERIHESESGLFDELRSFFKSGGTNYNSEFRMKAVNGEYIWLRLAGTLIFDKDEKTPIKFIGNLVNVNAQVIHELELKTQAETDGLSGLLNKTYMEKSVSKFLAENKQTAFAAFFIIDLDNFKQVNDRLGHSFGDQAICDTANKLALVFSEKDFIGRIGGDEFCVFLCLKTTTKNAREVVEQKANTLKSILAQEYSNGEITVRVTPSIGISLFPEQALSYRDLFKKADIALYSVKNSGKNNFAVYNADMGSKGESVYE